MARRKVTPALAGWSAVDDVTRRLVELDIDRRKIEADRDSAIAKARESAKVKLAKIASEAKALDAQVEQYAEANREDFGKKKSMERTHATLSFRSSTPAVKTISKWTFAKALDVVKEHARRFVRIVRELDKEKVLADHAAGKVTDEQLAELGLRVVKEETFAINLKTEEKTDDQAA